MRVWRMFTPVHCAFASWRLCVNCRFWDNENCFAYAPELLSPGRRALTAPGGGGYLTSMSVATIQAEVLSLPPGERAKLIDVLWDSLASPEVTSREAAWAEESERRIDAFEAGKLKARDAGTVFSGLRKDLRK